ncbi:hypothetical protein D9619_001404 [Psilocybe cf. subviscida]|uniref:Very-long-chain (3R)-3-hydroxyacyl-CoA dehydratase n=1 Tax=Psilocybe cf. subviscida TaxID=2480587 RepID=A0A8H5BCP5_9AGAR|nr:hypothetical protein D9619_001404 [Psilocybe cf. subviscida]
MSEKPAARSPKAKRATPAALKAYLVAYNILSALGWGYILALTVTHILNLDGKSDNFVASHGKTATSVLSRFLSTVTLPKALRFLSPKSIEAYLPAVLQPIYRRTETTFARVGPTTVFVQTFALLEVVHAALGWVRSPVVTTAMQVSSRLFMVWGIAEQFPEVRTNPLYTTMVLAWSTTEVIRYPFYAFNLVDMNPYILLWLRYTTFYVLYPLGAFSEAGLIFAVLPSSPLLPSWKSVFTGIWTTADYVRGFLFLIWWPGLYIMYTYMIVQRRKTLGKPKVKTT